MTRNQPCQLVDILAEVPDPRKKKGKRHPLRAILGLIVVGLQKQVFDDIKDLFQPFSETDPQAIEERRFQTLHTQADAHLDEHTTEETKRGILTTRTLTASTLLNEHLNWPGLEQVYEYRTHREHLATGETTHDTQYGITSLTPEKLTTQWARLKAASQN